MKYVFIFGTVTFTLLSTAFLPWWVAFLYSASLSALCIGVALLVVRYGLR